MVDGLKQVIPGWELGDGQSAVRLQAAMAAPSGED